jgi:thioester reductase-like protein
VAGGSVLFTGFPGFIGKRLVARLLADDADVRVVALVEPRMTDAARDAVTAIEGGDRIEVLAGDITDRRLGVSDADYDRLAADTTVAYHLAAIYNLHVPLEIAQKVNVEGTGNVLDLCARCEKLERLNYVSTAYVAGERTGVIYEHELSLGQRFKNHYESTKFQAELWVREYDDKVPTTVYRPAIVVGDSQTGETVKFDGPYYMLRSIARMGRGPLAQYGRAGAPFNVVPIDFIVDALATAAHDPAAVGETLHLVDPEPVTSAELYRLLAREYAGREPALRVPAKLIETGLKVPAMSRAFAGAPPESIRYLNHPVRFDTRRASDLLARHGLRCPRFEEYVPAMVRFFREHEDDPKYMPA